MIHFHPSRLSCHRCAAVAWEFVAVRTVREGWKTYDMDIVRCAFCGLLELVDQPVGYSPQAEYRFETGRFAGLSVSEVASQPQGRDYLEVIRRSDPALKKRIDACLGGT
jgi:hypothetical protein